VPVHLTTGILLKIVVKNVTSNVKNVLKLLNTVLLVLVIDNKKPLQPAHVHLVLMKATKLVVQHVLTNVVNVLLMKSVLPVVKTDLTLQLVIVLMVIMN
jgi:hypothetical protein